MTTSPTFSNNNGSEDEAAQACGVDIMRYNPRIKRRQALIKREPRRHCGLGPVSLSLDELESSFVFGDGPPGDVFSVDDAVSEALSVSAPRLRQHNDVVRGVESFRSWVEG